MGLYIWGRKDLLVRANLRFLAPGRLHILIDMTNIMTLGWDFFLQLVVLKNCQLMSIDVNFVKNLSDEVIFFQFSIVFSLFTYCSLITNLSH